MDDINPWKFVLLFIALIVAFGVLFQIHFPKNLPPENETDEERAQRVFDEFP
jgi:hypothetical protein